MKKILALCIAVFLVIIGCNRNDEPTSNSGSMNIDLVETKRNGIAFPDTLRSFNINKNDTIEFTVAIQLDYLYEDVRLDSISGYIEMDLTGQAEFQAKEDSLVSQAESFAFSEHVNSEVGNQKIYRTYQFINTVDRVSVYDDFSGRSRYDLNVNLNVYASPDEGLGKYPADDISNYQMEDAYPILNLELDNKYRVTTFRLYNNYVGKDPNDSTGVGFDINDGEYCHDLAALYCYYENEINCVRSCDRTLVNLTYDTLYNTSNAIFIPAFGVNHLARSNVMGELTSAPIIAYINADGAIRELFNWERGHRSNKSYDYFSQTEKEVLEVLEPEVGQNYYLSFSSPISGVTSAFIRVKDIVENGLNSYVEFDLAVDTRQLPQPEDL
jgi:hypothetical protein